MTNCATTATSPYLPLASAGIGFLGALFLYFLKERLDLRARRREAIYFLLFFASTLEKAISAGGSPTRSSSNFDEAIRKLASARLDYYDWPEIEKLAVINTSWLAGEYTTTVHKQPILAELEALTNSVKAKAKQH